LAVEVDVAMSLSDQTLSPTRFPVSVIMKRRQIERGAWSMPQWDVVGVVAGAAVAGAEIKKTVIRSDGEGEQYLWTGFSVDLFKDSAESYWYNLVAKTPSLFVICRPDEDYGNDLVPYAVSANYDEAGAHMEADDTVFSAPMPPEVYRWLEAYVMENYSPQAPYKRKRKHWLEERGNEQTPDENDHTAG
jgi:hypothetical protein